MISDDRTREPLVGIIIDDDPDHSMLIGELLKDSARAHFPDGLTVVTYSDPVEALANMPLGQSVILCDYNLAGSCALDWMVDFARASSGPVILLTSSGSENIAASAFRLGAADYIVKSDLFAKPELIVRSIKEALRRNRLERSNQELSRNLKVLNSELQIKNSTLADLTETAHRFVDDVAHEFRTPLAVIQEFASIISDGIGGTLTARQTEFMGHIDHAVRDLAGLVDDFLDTSRLRAQTLRVDRSDHCVETLFQGVRPTLELRAASKRIRLTERIDAGLPRIFIDLEKARRVITNLAINAIKFSPPGSEVILSARRVGADDIEIGVTDFGPGISPKDIAAIFQRFAQTDRARRPGVKGFGLGLSIAQELVALNLGTLGVTSEVGKTSTFSFTVPVNFPPAVLNRHLARICQDPKASHVAMLRAFPVLPGESLEALRSEVVSICHAWDLVWPDPDTGSLILVGATGDPERWVSRLHKELVQSGEALNRTGSLLRFSIIGCWSAAQAAQVIPGKIGASTVMEVARAA